MSFLFKRLVVYQEACFFGGKIFALTSKVTPRHFALADQLRRAAMSVPANIAEGWGRLHPREKKQFYRIAMGSVSECVPHLELALSDQMITRDQFDGLMVSADRIARLLNGLIHSVKR